MGKTQGRITLGRQCQVSNGPLNSRTHLQFCCWVGTVASQSPSLGKGSCSSIFSPSCRILSIGPSITPRSPGLGSTLLIPRVQLSLGPLPPVPCRLQPQGTWRPSCGEHPHRGSSCHCVGGESQGHRTPHNKPSHLHLLSQPPPHDSLQSQPSSL